MNRIRFARGHKPEGRAVGIAPTNLYEPNRFRWIQFIQEVR